MSYEARGEGYVTLKEKLPEKILKELDVWHAGFKTVEEQPNNELYLVFGGMTYHSDLICSAFKKLARYATEGIIEFIGDDDTYWRFVFSNGKFKEERGEITYPSDGSEIEVTFTSMGGEGFIGMTLESTGFVDRVNEILKKFYDYVDDHGIEVGQIVDVVERR